MAATKKIQFDKSPVGVFHLAYFVGDVVLMHSNQADVLIEAGFAHEYTDKPVETGLPADIPHREKLIAAGVTTLEELKEYNDFTEIDGIGVKAGKAIDNYLNK